MRDDEANRLRTALGRISRFVDRQVDGGGMTRTQLSVLGTIARRRSMPISELAEVEGLNPSMVSRVVGKLDDAGLVRRSADPGDRRSVLVEVTAAGTRLHTRLRQQRTRLFVERVEGLSAGQMDALVDALPALEALAEELRPATRLVQGSVRA